MCIRDRSTWDVAFCLSQMPMNEKAIKKLLEMFDIYRIHLAEASIMDCFRAIVNKYKKIQKAEVRVPLEELENRLNNFMKTVPFEERKRKDPAGAGKGRARGGSSQPVDQTNEENKEDTIIADKKDMRNARSKGRGGKNNKKKRGKNIDSFLEDDEEVSSLSENEEDEFGDHDKNMSLDQSRIKKKAGTTSSRPPAFLGSLDENSNQSTRSLRSTRRNHAKTSRIDEGDDAMQVEIGEGLDEENY
eukprot:TRINITY_DN9618_c0_g1_i1.p1 TRINITY_DN9618_c0_g1~~TRINITY_DN9618_c0_g1_i1.p1  ORF type:complete len:245 (-),score=76.75 TRINITY_DN9618_c0_g1_i1:167-901(-)